MLPAFQKSLPISYLSFLSPSGTFFLTSVTINQFVCFSTLREWSYKVCTCSRLFFLRFITFVACSSCLLYNCMLKMILVGVHISFKSFHDGFFKVYLFWEREKESRGGPEREGDKESEAGSRLWAVSTEPNLGLQLTNRETMTWAQVGCLTDWVPQHFCFFNSMDQFHWKTLPNGV